jgi:hypothetical protein
MVEFLLSLIPVCLGIWGIHILFQEDHLLEKLGTKLRGPERSPDVPLDFRKKIMKPLFDCPICMSSVWGAIGFIAMSYFFGITMPIKQIFPFVFCLCGLNTIILKLTSKERKIVDE